MSEIKTKPIYRTGLDAITRMAQPDYAVRNFLTKDDTPHISMAVAELSSGQGADSCEKQGGGIWNEVSRTDRIYYFITAENCSAIYDDMTINIIPDSMLFVPKNTQYTITGNFRAVLINTPAFDKNAEIK